MFKFSDIYILVEYVDKKTSAEPFSISTWLCFTDHWIKKDIELFKENYVKPGFYPPKLEDRTNKVRSFK